MLAYLVNTFTLILEIQSLALPQRESRTRAGEVILVEIATSSNWNASSLQTVYSIKYKQYSSCLDLFEVLLVIQSFNGDHLLVQREHKDRQQAGSGRTHLAWFSLLSFDPRNLNLFQLESRKSAKTGWNNQKKESKRPAFSFLPLLLRIPRFLILSSFPLLIPFPLFHFSFLPS